MTIQSPCIKVCVLDPRSGFCRGCARNVEEIAGWAAMPDGERARIMAQLPQRRRAFGLGDVAAANAD